MEANDGGERGGADGGAWTAMELLGVAVKAVLALIVGAMLINFLATAAIYVLAFFYGGSAC